MNNKKNHFMALALEEARAAATRGEVPVGAVIVDSDGHVLAKAGNKTIEQHDPTAHAEILVIREACSLKRTERLADCDLYVTLEPCPMCASAISQTRIKRLYYGAEDVKSGGVDNGPRLFTHRACHHKPEVYGGFAEDEAAALLKSFFENKRD